MGNFHNVSDGDGGRKLVPFTAEEETHKAAKTAKMDDRKAAFQAKKYQRDRKAAYGELGDQLDMQYHDLVDGTETWKSHVSKVKSDNAKP